VVSVHRRAVNLLFDGGPLVGVLPADRPIHPWAVTTTVPLSAFSVDQPFEAGSDLLVVGDCRLDLSITEVVDLQLNEVPTHLASSIPQLLESLAGPISLADPFSGTIADALDELRASADVSGLAELVGLGSGYTPSGDDIIVGALAALELCRGVSERAVPLRRCLIDALPSDLHTHTPRLSAQLLEAACDGRYAEPILEVLRAVTGTEELAIRDAANRLASLGHSSGRDSLRGLTAMLWVLSRHCE
jgi:hypothetical protein